MDLTGNFRQQLAAKALQRQLERVSQQAQAPARSLAQELAQAPGSASGLTRDALCSFETMPGYTQVKLLREMGDKLRVTSPFFRVHEGTAGATTQITGKQYLNFANYNYLGLAGDAQVNARAKAAIDQYGTSASASRMVAGERTVHGELEHAMARFYDADDALVFVSGHATNVTVIGSLFGQGDLVVHDSLAHNSILQGAQLSGAKRLNFPHNDWRALDDLLTRVRHEFRRVLIVVEGLYSMDGDILDLARFVEVKRRHAAFLMVDEAHSLGDRRDGQGHPRVLRRAERGRRYLDGHAQQDAGRMRRIYRGLAGAGGYPAASGARIPL